MDDPFLPWWLVLLLGMWAVALTVWYCPSVHREIRLWAGLASFVYCLMIFLALGGGSPTGSSSSFKLSDLFLFVSIAISVTASLWSLSRFTMQSRQLAYVLFTVANSMLCFYWQQIEVGLGLVVIAGLKAIPLIQSLARQKAQSFRVLFVQMTKFQDVFEPVENQGEFLLIGGLTGVVALLLLGTVSYGIRTETARAVSSPRHSILPPNELLTQVFAQQIPPQAEPSFWKLILGVRSDIVVLLTVIVFLNLAMSLTSQAEARAGGIVASEQNHLPGHVGEVHEP